MKTSSLALIPRFAAERSFAVEAGLVSLGVVLLAVLAQVAIPLPWTPVPITGQTFGVMLVALLWGAKRGGAVLALYLLVGSLGGPVFASGRSGLVFGPTIGYLIGMPIAALVVGKLADRGWTRSFGWSYLACMVGSAIIFTCGLAVLSRFVPGGASAVAAAGLLPFLPGDVLKSGLAALIASRASRLGR